jgi:hypothetical protein
MSLATYLSSLSIFLFATLLVAGCAYFVLQQLAGRKAAASTPMPSKE